MENTLENKAKFFSQYWGQSILHNTNGGYNADNESANWHERFEDDILELKPLSSISDEDISYLYIDGIKDINENGYFFTKGMLIKWEILDIDYLRSKGYALSWMNLSVEKLLDYGWIKLIN